MNYGLTDDELKFLLEKIVEPLKKHNAKVYLFGSRAKNKHSKFSDIDLVYYPDKNKQISSSEIYLLLMEVEDSKFPYKIDLVNYEELAKNYRQNVDQEKLPL